MNSRRLMLAPANDKAWYRQKLAYWKGHQCPLCAISGQWHLSFKQLVGAAGQRQWHINAERFGSFQIDVELNLGRLLNRQIGRLIAFENSADLDAAQAI